MTLVIIKNGNLGVLKWVSILGLSDFEKMAY